MQTGGLEAQGWELIVKAAQALRDYALLHSDGRFEKITYAQEKILGIVFAHDEGLMLKDLAKELNLTPSAVSQSIEILVRENLLERRTSSLDRRAITIHPTEKCRKKRELSREKFTRVMAEAFHGLDHQDRQAFISTLEKVVSAVKNCQGMSIRRTRGATLVGEERV